VTSCLPCLSTDFTQQFPTLLIFYLTEVAMEDSDLFEEQTRITFDAPQKNQRSPANFVLVTCEFKIPYVIFTLFKSHLTVVWCVTVCRLRMSGWLYEHPGTVS